jgi:hypothetical protein
MLLYVIIYWVLSKYPFLLKEFKMSVLSRQKDESAAIVENTENLLSESANNKARDGIAAPVLQGITSLPVVRREKVLAIRKQLDEGTYDLDERLDVVLDGLLADLTAQDNTVTRSC